MPIVEAGPTCPICGCNRCDCGATEYHAKVVELQAEKKELINGINKVIEAIQSPLNNEAIVDTLWMPDMQACTVVDYLSALERRTK